MADGLQHAVAFGMAVFAVDQVKAVDIEQHQRAIEAGPALLFQPDLRAQIAGVGQLRDAVESAVVAKQAFALLQVFVQAKLFLAPVIHSNRHQQHAERNQRFEPVVPQVALVDGKELIEAIGPRAQHNGAQPASQQARDQPARPAAERKQKPDAGHHGRAALADDVHPLPGCERLGRAQRGVQQEENRQRQNGDDQAVAVQLQHNQYLYNVGNHDTACA